MSAAAAAAREVARKVERRALPYLHRRTVQMRNPRAVVTFTFDDFPRSAATEGASILEASGARGTFYLAGGTMGRPQDLERGTAVEPDDIVTMQEVDELAQAGHEIGCHTFDHIALRAVDRREIADQCQRNHAVAGGGSDRRLTSFAYPFGSVSRAAKREASLRHASCRGLSAGVNAGTADLACLRAVSLRDSAVDADGVERWLLQASRVRGWLIFGSHDVRPVPSHWGVTPDLLRYSVEAARRLGMDILPMRSAVGRVVFGDDSP